MTDKKNSASLRGTIAENPVLVLFLGLSTALGATDRVLPALAIGAAVLVVMLLSNVALCLLRRAVPDAARIPVCLIVTAFFASVAQLLMNAFLPEIYSMLGVYLAATAVNLAVVHEAELSASGRAPGASLASALRCGLAFIAALFCMAAVREIFGYGSFAGSALPFFGSYNVPILAQAPGGLLVFGLLLAAVAKIFPAQRALPRSAACEAAGLENSEEQM